MAELLDARLAAVRARDRDGFADLLADSSSRSGRALLAEYDVMVALPLVHLRQQPVSVLPARSGAGGDVVVRSAVTYRLAGFDRADRADRVAVESFTVRGTTSGWELTGAPPPEPVAGAAPPTDPAAPAAPWKLPGAVVRTGERSLVVGVAPAATLAAYARMADEAVTQVDSVWRRSWPRTMVVIVPGDRAGFLAQLGGPGRDLTEVAAVTDGPLGPDGLATGDRVVLNPDALTRLTAAGRQFVLTHEATHVAVRASLNGRAPVWLTEGLADHIGYRYAGAAPDEVAAGLLADVAAGDGPTSLPDDGGFDPTSGHISPVYAAAWLAVEQLVDHLGEDGLLRFYEEATSRGPAASAEQATARAFADVAGTTEAAFTTTWLAELSRMARAR